MTQNNVCFFTRTTFNAETATIKDILISKTKTSYTMFCEGYISEVLAKI